MDDTSLDVLVWNYHDDLVPVAATPVHLVIKVPAGFGPDVRVSHVRVDDSHGDAHRVWVSQGMPPQPSAAERDALRQAMDPVPLFSDASIAVASDGSVGVDFELPRFGVSLLTLHAGKDRASSAVAAH
jgi:xylan 1,4-beta-xylosidase